MPDGDVFKTWLGISISRLYRLHDDLRTKSERVSIPCSHYSVNAIVRNVSYIITNQNTSRVIREENSSGKSAPFFTPSGHSPFLVSPWRLTIGVSRKDRMQFPRHVQLYAYKRCTSYDQTACKSLQLFWGMHFYPLLDPLLHRVNGNTPPRVEENTATYWSASTMPSSAYKRSLNQRTRHVISCIIPQHALTAIGEQRIPYAYSIGVVVNPRVHRCDQCLKLLLKLVVLSGLCMFWNATCCVLSIRPTIGVRLTNVLTNRGPEACNQI